jgi:YD repeat-containing protein
MTTITLAVTIGSDGTDFYNINGSKQPAVSLLRGNTYIFDQSDATNSGHPLRVSITSDGTHGSGVAYTSGVTNGSTVGSSGAFTQIIVAPDAPDALYYYCSNHSGMGGSFNVSGVDITSVGDMSATADLAIADNTVTSFTDNTEIFSATLAKEIPAKLNAIATAFKTHVNTELMADAVAHDNAAVASMVSHINSFVTSITSYMNATVIDHLNTALATIATDQSTYKSNVATQQNTAETTYQTNYDTFIASVNTNFSTLSDTNASVFAAQTATLNTGFDDLQVNLANYVGVHTTYSKAEIDNTIFTGSVPSTDISYDGEGRIVSVKSEGKLVWNITYDSDGYLESFKEDVELGGIIQRKNYVVTTDATGQITAINVIV